MNKDSFGQSIQQVAKKVEIKKLNDKAIIPQYQSEGASGFDLHSIEKVSLAPKQTELIDTGIAVSIPKGFEIQIRPRSGLSLKENLTIPNSPGTVDSDYRGELKVMLHNMGTHTYHISEGQRIAQAVLARVPKAEIVEVEELDDTERGADGFGSTGE